MDQVAELLAITGAPSRVGVEDHVPLSRHNLLLEVEAVSVVGERTAVNFEDQRIFLGRIEAGRLDDPAVNLSFVKRRVVRALIPVLEEPAAMSPGVLGLQYVTAKAPFLATV